jgi:hypothetical protein
MRKNNSTSVRTVLVMSLYIRNIKAAPTPGCVALRHSLTGRRKLTDTIGKILFAHKTTYMHKQAQER